MVLAISQVDDESQLTQETALPSSTRPSDHVSLVATFMFRDAVDSQPSQQAVGRSLVANGQVVRMPMKFALTVQAVGDKLPLATLRYLGRLFASRGNGPNPYQTVGSDWYTTLELK